MLEWLLRIPGGKLVQEVILELRKVTWPSREQTLQRTTLVIVASLIVGIYIGALDFAFAHIMSVVIK